MSIRKFALTSVANAEFAERVLDFTGYSFKYEIGGRPRIPATVDGINATARFTSGPGKSALNNYYVYLVIDTPEKPKEYIGFAKLSLDEYVAFVKEKEFSVREIKAEAPAAPAPAESPAPAPDAEPTPEAPKRRKRVKA